MSLLHNLMLLCWATVLFAKENCRDRRDVRKEVIYSPSTQLQVSNCHIPEPKATALLQLQVLHGCSKNSGLGVVKVLLLPASEDKSFAALPYPCPHLPNEKASHGSVRMV